MADCRGKIKGIQTEEPPSLLPELPDRATVGRRGRLEDHDTRTLLWLPLTDLPGPHYSGKTAVLGHTPQLDGRVLNGGHVVCIDTGCGYGGVLTAMDVDTGRIWQVGQD